MIKYKEIIKNKRLTDFEDTKEIVVQESVKHVPTAKKSVIKKRNGIDKDQRWFKKY